MSTKKKAPPLGMELLRATVPADTMAWFRQQAADQGIPIQSIVAPVLNAYARGVIQQSFNQNAAIQPDPHGNARR